MSDLPKLTPRLATVASFVRNGVNVADIGTDHAFIPVYLVNSNKCPKAFASDVVKGPLERAKQTAEEYRANDKIKFVLADGLNGIEKDEVQDIVIAGMGGELIARILEECSYSKDKTKHYVLQPMTAHEELREYLLKNKYKIEKETVITEKNGRKIYTVMSVYFTGQSVEKDELYYYVGEIPSNNDNNSRKYLIQLKNSFEKHLEGLTKSNNIDTKEIVHLNNLKNEILKLIDN